MTPDRLADGAQSLLVATMLGLPRLLAFMVIVPIFSSTTFPRLLRIAVAIGLSAPVAAGIYQETALQPLPSDLALIALKEILLGLLIGMPIAMPLWTVQSIGALVDNQRGANAAQMVTPFAQADASVLGGALLQALLVLLCSTGGLAVIYRLLLQSYDAWPVLQLIPNLAELGFESTLSGFDEFAGRTVLYAAPVIAVTLLVDYAFALVSVFAPQLQTYVAAMPVKSIAALAVLAIYATVLLSHSDDYFREVFFRTDTGLQRQSQ